MDDSWLITYIIIYCWSREHRKKNVNLCVTSAPLDLLPGIQSRIILLYPYNAIKNIGKFGKNFVTHIRPAEEQTTKKIKVYKTLIKPRFTKINLAKNLPVASLRN